MGGYLGTTPNAPRVVFCTPNTLVGPSGANRQKKIRISGEEVYSIGASVVAGMVRGHGHFENLGRLLRLPGFRKIFGPNSDLEIRFLS